MKFLKKITGCNFEGRTLRFFAFGSLLVPPQTLYLSFRISNSFDNFFLENIEFLFDKCPWTKN